MKVKLLRDLNYRGDKYKAGDELTVTDIFYNTMKTRGVFITIEEAEAVEATEEAAEVETVEEAVEATEEAAEVETVEEAAEATEEAAEVETVEEAAEEKPTRRRRGRKPKSGN